MKLNRNHIFIIISSIALFALLIIQVNWIFRSARIKEELFNEKANMVLSRTTEALNADKETCMKIDACVDENTSSDSPAKLGQDETHKIDSLFTYYMNFYNFHIDYSFEVAKPTLVGGKNENGFADYIYNKPIEQVKSKNQVELKLIFPQKRQFIMAEMGPLFITSVILIIVVLILFWRTILSLMKEKKISEHTTDFLNNMTHEFKTPLTNIALAGKMITKDINVKQEDKVKHYSGVILEENEKLRLQVEQILGMTALEKGEIPLLKNRLDLHLLIDEAIKCIDLQMEHKQGSLSLHPDAEKHLVMGDKTHLTNVLVNLLDNSIKYSKGKPQLSIRTFNLDHMLVIVLTDNGIGIDKEYQKKVFHKFFRVPTGDVHDVKGFGMGLAYVKKIVELHQGTIEMQSERGKGTTFTIKLAYVEG